MMAMFCKRQKIAKKCAIKHEIKFEEYKNCLENHKTRLRPQQRFWSKAQNLFIEKVNKIFWNINDDKIIKIPAVVTAYPSGYRC